MSDAIIDFKELDEYISNLHAPEENRLELLNRLIDAIKGNTGAELIFVCTHNSRRSQMSQVWAKVFADLNGIDLKCHSAGTEATAFNIRAVDALRRCGLEIEPDDITDSADNPHYMVRHSAARSRLDCWSKALDDDSLPEDNFIAIMTCGDADENCPFLPGALARIPLRYTDPKQKDDTPEEIEDYDLRCRHIASELKYVMNEIKQ